MRIDLHVHSDSSTHPNEWILRQLGAQESYTDPEDLYRIAKARGMDAVTITDHNTIDGCLSIAHHEDVFLSCEYTTYFRTDGCKAHVLCYNITPEQHQQIQEVRSDIFALVAFLKEHGIVHSLGPRAVCSQFQVDAGSFSALSRTVRYLGNQWRQRLLGESMPPEDPGQG